MNSEQQSFEKEPSIRDRVLTKIERKEVRMHSRTYFMLKIAGTILLAALILLLTVFIGNFVFFMLRINGHGALISLGMRGWLILLRVFPWWLLILDILLVAFLAWILRRFQFGYRKPILAVFLVLVISAMAAGFVLDKGTRFNDDLLYDADRGALPSPLDAVYKGARRSPPRGSAYRGTVISVQPGSFFLADPDFDEVQTVLLPTDSPDQPLPTLSTGDTVLVIGSEDHDVIRAVDISRIDPSALPPKDNDRGD